METVQLQQDIPVLCVRAASFPDGIGEAHRRLHALLPSSSGRTFYGISRPDGSGVIEYMAAVEETREGEAAQYGCETFRIRKGSYISETLEDWCSEENRVKDTFQKLLANPDIDPDGYCLEVYLNDRDMRCMVPLAPAGQQQQV